MQGREEYELFLRLAELGSSDLWQCATCQVGMGDMGLRWEKTGKVVAKNSVRIEKVEFMIGKAEARSSKLENELKNTKHELEDLKKSLSVVKEDALKMSVTEVVQRENIRSNIIIQNLAESNSNEPSERQAHDMRCSSSS